MKERTEWHDERERLIAGCMALEGFEYYPVEYQRLEGLDEVLSFDRDYLGIPLLPSTRAEVERWGYGEEAPLEFVTREGLTAGASAAQDENQRYVETLSAAAQAAYLTAYIGTADLAAALAEPGGCVAEADAGLPDEPVPEGPSERFRAQYGELAEEMARFGTSGVLEDARVAALASQWDKCMVGLGVDVSGETAPGVTMVTVPYANPNSARYLAMRTGSDGAVGAGGGGFFEDSLPVDQRSLVGSQAEARIALADFDCRAQTDYEARLLAVQLELEQEFVDENRAQLEEMVIAARGE
ncbi:MAG: hypothetical protein LBG60_02855 [Bifidobacteriaceae bacterium]|nr:hypothetical protein [Bifidobacteriaceae bacterium]